MYASLLYPTDLADAEWTILAPLVPPAKQGGRPRKSPLRRILDGIFYVLKSGCAQTKPRPGPPAPRAKWLGSGRRRPAALLPRAPAASPGPRPEPRPALPVSPGPRGKKAGTGRPGFHREDRR
jgi:putative transposase